MYDINIDLFNTSTNYYGPKDGRSAIYNGVQLFNTGSLLKFMSVSNVSIPYYRIMLISHYATILLWWLVHIKALCYAYIMLNILNKLQGISFDLCFWKLVIYFKR